MTTPSSCLLELSQLKPKLKNVRNEISQMQARVEFLEANLLIFSKQIKLEETNFGKTMSKEELKKLFDVEKVEARIKKKITKKKSLLK
jgi:hypothetical protein